MQPESVNQPAWIGIDVAKASVDAALYLGGPLGRVATFPRTPEGMAELARWARGEVGGDIALRAIMEATGRYSHEAVGWLLENDAAIAPACVNPLHAKRFAQSLGLRNKTDEADARMLARLGAERGPAPYEAPSPIHLELRALVRERRQLVEEQTRLRNRIGEGTDSAFVRNQRTRRLDTLKRDIKRLEDEITRVAAGDKSLKADLARLTTIPGVGTITAITIVAELGDLRRFASGRQLAAFAGVSPRRHESGSSVRARTSMCKAGNPTVRAALYMSAVTTARLTAGMRDVYTRLITNGKAPKSALGALMRKQLILMRALLVRGEDYRPPVEKSPHERAKNLVS